MAAALLAFLVLPPGPAALAAQEETLDVAPPRTVVPATVTVTGYCDAYETYWSLEGGAQQQYLRVDSERFEFAVRLVDQSGEDLPPGEYEISTDCGPSTSVEVLAAPSLRLDPTSGRPGATVTASGTCPPHSSGPEVYFDEEYVSTGTLDGTGSFGSATFTVPDVEPGDHDVTTSCEASAPFEVLPEIPATLGLDPRSGVVGDTVTARGTCPPSSDRVRIYFDDAFVGSGPLDAETGGFGPIEFPVPAAEVGPATVETDCEAEQTFTVTLPTEGPAATVVPDTPSPSGTSSQPGSPAQPGAPAQSGAPAAPASPRVPSADRSLPTVTVTEGRDGVVRVRVPDLSGLTEAEALAVLGEALVLHNPSGADGLVREQVPRPGTLVEPASAVSVLLAPPPEPSRWPLLALPLLVGAAVAGLVARERVRRRAVREERWLDEQVRTATTPHDAAVSAVPDRAVPGRDVRLEVRRHPTRL